MSGVMKALRGGEKLLQSAALVMGFVHLSLEQKSGPCAHTQAEEGGKAGVSGTRG